LLFKVNCTDNYGWTALHSAVAANAFHLAVYLIEIGANVQAVSSTADGCRTPLMLAIEEDDEEMIELLKEAA